MIKVQDSGGRTDIHLHIPNKVIAFVAIMFPYSLICIFFYFFTEGDTDLTFITICN